MHQISVESFIWINSKLICMQISIPSIIPEVPYQSVLNLQTTIKTIKNIVWEWLGLCSRANMYKMTLYKMYV